MLLLLVLSLLVSAGRDLTLLVLFRADDMFAVGSESWLTKRLKWFWLLWSSL